MADEKEITSSEGSLASAAAVSTASDTAAADSHKRKLEDLELNNVPEPPTESEPDSNADALNNGTQEENGGVEESETKRPRLESNGDNVSEADGLDSQNGNLEEENNDEPKEEEPEQPESADANVEPVEDQEPLNEPLDTINQDPASNENEKTEIGSSGKLGQLNVETEEPSELHREGDVPVHSDEIQPGSDRQILSRKMEVPIVKVGVLIGKSGNTIRSLQDNSGAKIQIMRDADADLRSTTRRLELVGTLEDINKAEKLIKDVIAKADAGGSPSRVARGFNTAQAANGGDQVEIQVPIEKVECSCALEKFSGRFSLKKA